LNYKDLYFEQRPMTRKQVMDYLQVGKSALHKYITEEGLPHIHMGNRLRFWKKDVDEWLNARVVRNKVEQNGTNLNQNGSRS
jgi:excisionase family DNA binding protein